MAHEMSRKINRIFEICKLRYYSSKATTPITVTACNKTENNKSSPTEQNNEVKQPTETKKQEQPVITSDLEKNELQLRRRFAKSSTQIALTQPLKLPRLANPFPEPVKTLPSDTVADDEKARLMHEQVKMEARYHLQMQQEKMLQEKFNKMNQEQNIQNENTKNENMQQNERHNTQQPYEQFQNNMPQNNMQQPYEQFHNGMPQNNMQQYPHEQFQNSMPQNNMQQPYEQFQNVMPQKKMKNKQPNYRKPKDYNELQNEQIETQQNSIPNQHQQNGFQNQQQYDNGYQNQQQFNNGFQSHSPQNEFKDGNNMSSENKSKRTRSRGGRSRQARHVCYSRHSRRQAHRQISTMSFCRLYSTKSPILNPDIIPESEQADYILERLKTLYPEYKSLKKPVFISGSEEEREFIQHILRLLGKHKLEAQTIKKTSAPFPSYSEIKTYVHNQKQSKKPFEYGNFTSEKNHIRYYHTDKDNKPISVSYPGVKKNKKNYYVPYNPKKKIPKKQEAPYPAYSEVNDEYDESTFLNQWRPDTTFNREKKYYTTTTNNTTVDVEKQAKKKPPCKCPFPPLPECDYEETARKNAEKKKRQGRCPKNKKSAASSEEDSTKVISKIKTWLNSYKINSENIKIIRSPIDLEGRETYVIEVDEANEVTAKELSNLEEKPPEKKEAKTTGAKPKNMPFQNIDYKTNECELSHVTELSDKIPVTVKNIPGFNSSHEPDPIVAKPETKKTEPVNSICLVPVKASEIRKVENLEKIKHILGRKTEPTKINVVKEHLQIKPKSKKGKRNTIIEEDVVQCKVVNSNVYKLTNFKPPKPKPKKPTLKKYSLDDFDYFNTRIDNKCKEIKYRNDLPAPCPIIKPHAYLAPKKDKKEKKPACEKKKKCRYKKKRKLPRCEDVPGNKTKTCMPFYISELDNKNMSVQEYNSKATFCNLKSEDVDVLANESLRESHYEPFKLKPQFWRK